MLAYEKGVFRGFKNAVISKRLSKQVVSSKLGRL